MSGADWLKSKEYDDWKTTPDFDDYDYESKCHCVSCGDPLFYDDEYYELEDEIYCEYCAEKWLESKKNWVSESMVNGD